MWSIIFPDWLQHPAFGKFNTYPNLILILQNLLQRNHLNKTGIHFWEVWCNLLLPGRLSVMYWLFHNRVYLVSDAWKIIHNVGAKKVLLQLFYFGQKDSVCPEGEEGAGADRGGRVGNNHLFLEANPVCGRSQGPSKAFAWQAGGDWPGCRGGCRAAQLCPQSGADLGQSEEGRRHQQAPGESVVEAGPFQDWLIHSNHIKWIHAKDEKELV